MFRYFKPAVASFKKVFFAGKLRNIKRRSFSLAQGDKKNETDGITLVLPSEEIGRCVLKKVSMAEFEKMLSVILH